MGDFLEDLVGNVLSAKEALWGRVAAAPARHAEEVEGLRAELAAAAEALREREGALDAAARERDEARWERDEAREARDGMKGEMDKAKKEWGEQMLATEQGLKRAWGEARAETALVREEKRKVERRKEKLEEKVERMRETNAAIQSLLGEITQREREGSVDSDAQIDVDEWASGSRPASKRKRTS